MSLVNLQGGRIPQQAQGSPLQISDRIKGIEAQIPQLEKDLSEAGLATSKYVLNGQQNVNLYRSDEMLLQRLRAELISLSGNLQNSNSAARDWITYVEETAEAVINDKLKAVAAVHHAAVIANFNLGLTSLVTNNYFAQPENQNVAQVKNVVVTVFNTALGQAIVEGGTKATLGAVGGNPGEHETEIPDGAPTPEQIAKQLTDQYKSKKIMTLADRQRHNLGVSNAQ